MKTNISKKELKAMMNDLMDRVQEVGYQIGSEELNYMTDEFRDKYAIVETTLGALIGEIDNLK